MQILLDDEIRIGEHPEDTMEKIATLAVKGEGLNPEKVEVSVTIVSLDEIHDLNRDYRGVDRPTDVLSFPQYEPEEIREMAEGGGDMALGEPVAIGDVVVCIDKIREQAAEFGHSEERELFYLFTHSVLHLLGYDHMEEDEKVVMRKREEEILSELGINRQ